VRKEETFTIAKIPNNLGTSKAAWAIISEAKSAALSPPWLLLPNSTSILEAARISTRGGSSKGTWVYTCTPIIFAKTSKLGGLSSNS